MKLRTLLPVLAIVICIAFLPSIAHAMQPPTTNIVDTPFDGGLSLLVAASVGYAAKKGHDKRKKNKATVDSN